MYYVFITQELNSYQDKYFHYIILKWQIATENLQRWNNSSKWVYNNNKLAQ